MTSRYHPLLSGMDYTAAERQSLRALRARYQEDPDFFSARELGCLRFMRWLRHRGVFDEDLASFPACETSMAASKALGTRELFGSESCAA